MTKIGVVDIESFFPAKERFALAMKLNNLLSAPGFAAWLEGEPLDVGALLHSATGKPAHLDLLDRASRRFAADVFRFAPAERNPVVDAHAVGCHEPARAVVHGRDFRLLPADGEPALEAAAVDVAQAARAFGLGIMLATQNPVDLDYKGLANCGTWFLGRLQTERDKARVIEGLQGAAASAGAQFDKQAIMQVLSGLKNRVFLMNNVHEDAPVVFQARWAMSYLCGPLSRDQIKKLCDSDPGARATITQPAAGDTGGSPSSANVASGGANGGVSVPGGSPTSAGDTGNLSTSPPLVPPQISQYFVPLRGARPVNTKLVYQPSVLGMGTVHFTDKKLSIDAQRPICWLAGFHPTTGAIDWTAAQQTPLSDDDLEKQAAEQTLFASLPAEGSNAKAAAGWQKGFADALYRLAKIDLLKSASLDQVSKPDESERDFRIRLQQAAREERDALLAKLRDKYAPKQAALEEKVRKAEQKVSREKSEARGEMWQTVISFGATILDVVLGRKRLSATTGARERKPRPVAWGRSMKQSADVNEAEESVEALQAQAAQLAKDLEADTAAAQSKTDPLTETLETISLRPKKTDIAVRLTALVWLPEWQDAGGASKPAWQ